MSKVLELTKPSDLTKMRAEFNEKMDHFFVEIKNKEKEVQQSNQTRIKASGGNLKNMASLARKLIPPGVKFIQGRVPSLAEAELTELLNIAQEYLELLRQDQEAIFQFFQAFDFLVCFGFSKNIKSRYISFFDKKFKDVDPKIYQAISGFMLSLYNLSVALDIILPAEQALESENLIKYHIDQKRAPLQYSIGILKVFFTKLKAKPLISHIEQSKTELFAAFDLILKTLKESEKETIILDKNGFQADCYLLLHFADMLSYYLCLLPKNISSTENSNLAAFLKSEFNQELNAKSLVKVKQYYELHNQIIQNCKAMVDELLKLFSKDKLSSNKLEKVTETYRSEELNEGSILDLFKDQPETKATAKDFQNIASPNPNTLQLNMRRFSLAFETFHNENKEMIEILDAKKMELFTQEINERRQKEMARFFPAPKIPSVAVSVTKDNIVKHSHQNKPKKSNQKNQVAIVEVIRPVRVIIHNKKTRFEDVDIIFNHIAMLDPHRRRAELNTLMQHNDLDNLDNLYKSIMATIIVSMDYLGRISHQMKNVPKDLNSRQECLLQLGNLFIKLYDHIEKSAAMLESKESIMKQSEELFVGPKCHILELSKDMKEKHDCYQTIVEDTMEQLTNYRNELKKQPWWTHEKASDSEMRTVSLETIKYREFSSLNNNSKAFNENIGAFVTQVNQVLLVEKKQEKAPRSQINNPYAVAAIPAYQAKA